MASNANRWQYGEIPLKPNEEEEYTKSKDEEEEEASAFERLDGI